MDVICEVALRCGIGVLACLAVVLVVVGIALLVERRSVGSFRNAVVLQRLFRRLLMTAALAPSSQGWRMASCCTSRSGRWDPPAVSTSADPRAVGVLGDEGGDGGGGLGKCRGADVCDGVVEGGQRKPVHQFG